MNMSYMPTFMSHMFHQKQRKRSLLQHMKPDVIVCDDIDGLPPTKKPCIVQFEENVGREVKEKLAKEILSLRQSPFSGKRKQTAYSICDKTKTR